jgi:hypothetical protein
MSGKPTKSDKVARRRMRAARKSHRSRGGKDRWSIQAREYPVGPDITAPTMDEILAAIDSVPKDLNWEAVSGLLIPIFPRVRPFDIDGPDPARLIVPPGLAVELSVHISPAYLKVAPGMLEHWGRRADEVPSTALANLQRRAAGVSPETIVRGSIDGVPTQWLQSGLGCASTFVLLPAELERIFGAQPQLFIAPMRDLLIGLPPDVGRDLAAWLYAEIAAQDPNCLPPFAFPFADGKVGLEPLGPAFGEA